MPWLEVIWVEGPDGNIEHIAEHGITVDEVEHVLLNPVNEDVSRATGRPIVYGRTRAGRFIAVVYEVIDDVTVYPITAFEIEES